MAARYTNSMKARKHPIKHQYQTSPGNCSQTALSTMLSQFNNSYTVEEISKHVPVGTYNDETTSKHEEWGTINMELATWCVKQGFTVDLHTFDFQIIDLEWADLSKAKLLERLEAAEEVRDVYALGEENSKIYVRHYFDFLKAGGDLHIHPYVSTKLLYKLLDKGPILACVQANVFYNMGRYMNIGKTETTFDDLSGNLNDHAVVIYGNDEKGDFLVADPKMEPGLITVDKEWLICAMTAASVENYIFTVTK